MIVYMNGLNLELTELTFSYEHIFINSLFVHILYKIINEVHTYDACKKDLFEIDRGQ